MAIYFLRSRKVGTFKFDSTVSEDHNETVRTTKNPVQEGYLKSDHAVVDPIQLSIRGRVQDWALNPLVLLGDQYAPSEGYFGFSEARARSQVAYEELRKLMRSRELLEVETGLGKFNNMLITNISTNIDKDTAQVLDAQLRLEEVLVTTQQNDIVTKDPQDSSGNLDEGIKAPEVPISASTALINGGLTLFTLSL